MEIGSYSTFEGLRPHFNALARGGYFKIVLKPTSRNKRFLQDAYRTVLWFLIMLYNLQHLIRVVQVRHSTEQTVDILFILLTTINTLGKQLTFNLRIKRVDRLINIIEGPIFKASKQFHVEAMKANALVMSRILKAYQTAIFTCGCLWTIFPFVNRALGLEVQLTGYFPFDTMTSPGFELAVTYMSILITFQAHGNVTMDCTIVAFYSQATTQIQILKHNLERLVDLEDTKIKSGTTGSNNTSRFLKNINEGQVQKRLANCVDHYQQIAWFTKEIESIFGEAMIVQFLVMAWVICMTVYKIVGLNIFSAEFVSMAAYLGCMLAQLFIYCYFGTQLKLESEYIIQSMYSGDWVSLLPKFRRQLLVMMEYCKRPMTPFIAGVIPMSLETYIEVLRSSYTLFTFLKKY